MIILTIRTDNPEAEIGLFVDTKKQQYHVWHAHLTLAETLMSAIRTLLVDNSHDFTDIQGLICFQGPGSFTGLRIGLTVANTLADSLQIPIVGCRQDEWIQNGITRLLAGENDKLVMPFYGAPVHITPQKK